MKSERRHQLEKNELADRLAGGIQSVQSYTPVIFGGVVLISVVALGWGLYSSSTKKKASQAWTEFYFNLTGGDADSFVDLANDFPQSSAAGWSRQIAGDNYLQRGIEAIYRDKKEGVGLIEQAIEAYEEIDQSAGNPELRSRAVLGLAQAYESLGDIDKAASYYQELAKVATQPGLINEANERLAYLTSPAGKEFYAWFEKQDPKPDAPINLPSDLSLPPTTPDLQFGPTAESPASATAPQSTPAVDPSALPNLSGQTPAIPTDASEADKLPAANPPPVTEEEPVPETTPATDSPAAVANPPAAAAADSTDGGS